MAKLTEERKEDLRGLTVTLLLEIRHEYLRTPGCSVLKHWDQLQTRMLAAARTCESVEEWATAMGRTLQLPAPGNSLSSAIRKLAAEVGTDRAAWLDLIEREYGFLLATARLEADRRKQAKDGFGEEIYPSDSDHPGVEAETNLGPDAA